MLGYRPCPYQILFAPFGVGGETFSGSLAYCWGFWRIYGGPARVERADGTIVVAR